MEKQILVYQWMRPNAGKNFGDLLSKTIMEGVLGKSIVVSNAADAEILAIGSVLDSMLTNGYPNVKVIWGSGFIRDGQKIDVSEEIDVLAVRGELTAKRLGFKGTLGDPGILASRYFNPSKIVKHKIGVVTHFLDTDNEIFDAWKENEKFVFIDVQRNPEKVIEDITGVEVIVSTSLHGLIIAESFGIPNYLISLSELVGTYKFLDYCSGISKSYDELIVPDIFNKTAAEIFEMSNEWRPVGNLEDKQNKLEESLRQYHPEVSDSENTYYVNVDDLSRLTGSMESFRYIRLYTNRKPIRDYRMHELNRFRTHLFKLGYVEISSSDECTTWQKADSFKERIFFFAKGRFRDVRWMAHVFKNIMKRRSIV